MNYAAAREHIKSGDLLAWSHRGFGSVYDLKIQAVRFFTRSEYSHVGLALVLGGRVWVAESVTPLPRIVPLSNLLPCYRLNVPTLNWRDDDTEFALSFVGNDRYSYSQREAIRGFFGTNNEADTLLECAEFVQIACAHAGLDLDCRATPSEVVLAVQKLGGTLDYLEK